MDSSKAINPNAMTVHIYTVADQHLAVIDGELYQRLPANGSAAPLKVADKTLRLPRRKRIYGSSHSDVLTTESEVKGRLQQDDINRMKTMINESHKAGAIAERFGVRLAYVYGLKNRMKKAGELTILDDSLDAETSNQSPQI